MKIMPVLSKTVLLTLLVHGAVFAQTDRVKKFNAAGSGAFAAAGSEKMAILPFQSIGVDEVSTQSAELLLRMELGKLSRTGIASEERTIQALGDELCTDVTCAGIVGERLGVNQVVLCSLSRLGDKVIIQYMLVDAVARKALLTDNTTSLTVEDLDTVMKRIAKSIVTRRPLETTAEVGAITEKESEEPRRRSARRFGGFSFGYLYPQNGYDDTEKSFTADFRTGYEMENVAVGSDIALRKGFAFNIYASYLLSKTDFCPYVGGAFGFHWVSHDDDHVYYTDEGRIIEEEKDGDGFEFILNTGLRAFRTYNFQILLNFEYSYTLNDFDDQAFVFTIGLMR